MLREDAQHDTTDLPAQMQNAEECPAHAKMHRRVSDKSVQPAPSQRRDSPDCVGATPALPSSNLAGNVQSANTGEAGIALTGEG